MAHASRSDNTPSRRQILRDIVIFELKLWLEGFKDVLLMPLSLGAAVIDLLLPGWTGRGALYGIKRQGDRFERWVDLYGALQKRTGDEERSPLTASSLDDVLNEVADGLEDTSNRSRDTTDPNESTSRG